MGWDAVPPDIVRQILDLRRRAMARELCEREKRRYELERKIYPLGMRPRTRDAQRGRHADIRRWCDRVSCDHDEWICAWMRSDFLWCQVCHRASTHGDAFCAAHPGRFCSEACFAFV